MGSIPSQTGGEQMTDEKICPFMSRPVHYAGAKTSFISGMVECKKERCMAWEPHHPVDEYDTFEGGGCGLIP
jgi:hypothetical protein